jgi:hypothetical protein
MVLSSMGLNLKVKSCNFFLSCSPRKLYLQAQFGNQKNLHGLVLDSGSRCKIFFHFSKFPCLQKFSFLENIEIETYTL